MLKICECTPKEQLPKIKCQLWEKVQYECKDGTVKQKSDFRPREISYVDFDTYFRKYWPTFALHHDVGALRDYCPLLASFAFGFALQVSGRMMSVRF